MRGHSLGHWRVGHFSLLANTECVGIVAQNTRHTKFRRDYPAILREIRASLRRTMSVTSLAGSIRLFVPDALEAGAAIRLNPGQAHYLGTVMRRSAGEMLRVFNGQDGEWAARLEEIRRDRAQIGVLEQTRVQVPEPDLWLAFAPLKRDATDMLVQKATELGVAMLLPVLTERTNTARLNLDRLTAIAIEAAEQCERLTVPILRAPVRLDRLLADWPPARPLFVGWERSEAPLLGPCPGPAGLLIGPEGGLSRIDQAMLLGCPAMRKNSLGPRILRAETAAIVGLTLLQAPGSG